MPDSLDFAPFGVAGDVDRSMLDRVRWLPGRALIRRNSAEMREHWLASGVIVPARVATHERELTSHRGILVAHGAPARLGEVGAIVPWHCAPGDEVLFVFALAMQKTRTFRSGRDEYVVVAQEEILAVVEAGPDTPRNDRPGWYEPGFDDAADDADPGAGTIMGEP